MHRNLFNFLKIYYLTRAKFKLRVYNATPKDWFCWNIWKFS